MTYPNLSSLQSGNKSSPPMCLAKSALYLAFVADIVAAVNEYIQIYFKKNKTVPSHRANEVRCIYFALNSAKGLFRTSAMIATIMDDSTVNFIWPIKIDIGNDLKPLILQVINNPKYLVSDNEVQESTHHQVSTKMMEVDEKISRLNNDYELVTKRVEDLRAELEDRKRQIERLESKNNELERKLSEYENINSDHQENPVNVPHFDFQ